MAIDALLSAAESAERRGEFPEAGRMLSEALRIASRWLWVLRSGKTKSTVVALGSLADKLRAARLISAPHFQFVRRILAARDDAAWRAVFDDDAVATAQTLLAQLRRAIREELRRPSRSCVYCGAGLKDFYPTRDHVLPKARFGSTATVLCCSTCNQAKGDRTPEEWVSDIQRWTERAARNDAATNPSGLFPTRREAHSADQTTDGDGN